jgi:predicted O-methyltransferase YrrM
MSLAELKQDLIDYRLESRRIQREAGVEPRGWIWRHYRRWRRDALRSSSPLEEGLPWVTYEGRAFLRRIMLPGKRVFEFGSGGSTIFAAERVAELVTAEHDREWADRVADEVKRRGLRNWRLLLGEPQTSDGPEAPESDSADPRVYRSSDPEYRDYHFRDYAASIDEFPEGYFDVIMIDGRARPSCFVHALPRLNAGGYLVLDNAERDEYRTIHQQLADLGWEKQDFSGPGPYCRYFWSTCAWRKPERSA